ncbi:cation:dicarboxylate symporter family transporter [Nocardia fusca]|uniref:cation:dicarboxylate symporter family transporter n=1 Tax=Nocardia fusca TaxID=941183 RepID=UPI0037C75437
MLSSVPTGGQRKRDRIASMDSLRKAGRIGAKALGYFVVLSLVSMLIGLIVANIFRPGAGMKIDLSELDAGSVPGHDQHADGVVEFIDRIIPSSLFGAITGNEILAALLVSIVFGCALNVSGERATPITEGLSALSTVVFKIVSWVMRLAPFGTFGALAMVVAKYGAVATVYSALGTSPRRGAGRGTGRGVAGRRPSSNPHRRRPGTRARHRATNDRAREKLTA